MTGIKVFPAEKAVDVMCALAVLRCARHYIDFVIMRPNDSDLIPASDE